MSLVGIEQINERDFKWLDEFFENYVCKYDEIWLVGTGKYADSWTEFLNQMGYAVHGYIESKFNKESFRGKPVKDIVQYKMYVTSYQKRCCLLLTVHSKYFSELYPKLMWLKKDLLLIPDSYLELAYQHFNRRDGITLCIPITENCAGISCYGCTSAVPVVKKKSIYDFEMLKNDMRQIYEVIGDDVNGINLTGGDVFLHPKLIEIIEFIRSLYSIAEISLSVNGILLGKQNNDFWNRLSKCNVVMNWTLYPIDYDDYGELFSYLETIGGIKIFINGDSLGEDKNSWRIPYTLVKQKKWDVLFCKHHKCCNNLLWIYENTLGVCHAQRALIHLINRFSEEDRLSKEFLNDVENYYRCIPKIDEIKSKSDIYSYMNSRITICDYCALRKRENMGSWMCSKADFEEWFV